MAICLFTDFGAGDLYVGQVEAVLDRLAPGVRVIHLLHEVPAYDIKPAAHLLAALVTGLAGDHVILGVVDPGVGTERDAVVVRADRHWYVGPDNGLFSVVAERAGARSVWRITGAPAVATRSFHGRDVFAPIAAALARNDFPNAILTPVDGLNVRLGGDDLAAIIYLDHYGNAWTGLRAEAVPRDRMLVVAGRELSYAGVFGEAPPGGAFWYANSSALVEVAVNRGSAAHALGLEIGMPVTWR
jgi:S-adenosyl-L-methionine hydrolase (adenosine-forming)